MKKFLVKALLLCIFLGVVLPTTAGAEMVTEVLKSYYGYVGSGGLVVDTITIDRKTTLHVEYGCAASNSITELLNSGGKVKPYQGFITGGNQEYPYGYVALYEIEPGDYQIQIIPIDSSFVGGKYWLSVSSMYDDHEHRYTEQGETISPTCSREGYTRYYCSCGEFVKADFRNTLPHTEVTDPAVAPTCLTTGLTEGTHCSVCKTTIIAQKKISCLEHDAVDGICRMCADPCGVCGDDLRWILKQETGNLQIYGTGAMYDWEDYREVPWSDYVYRDICTLEISDKVTHIGKEAFGSCRLLTSVSIPGSVTSIGDNAFGYCLGLQKITIPGSVITIGNGAFVGCEALTSITIPVSVTTIGDSLFDECSGLTQVSLPGNLTSIPYAMFRGCTSLAEITIPDTVTQIGKEAFSNCKNLAEMFIPKAVGKIEKYAYYNCSALKTIHFDGDAPDIHSEAFSSVTATAICYDDRDGWNTNTMQDYGFGKITWNYLHDYKSVVKKPTCLEQGYTTYTCGCGHIAIEDYVPATGHSMNNYRCKTCGYTGGSCGDKMYWELSSSGTLTITGSGAITSAPWLTRSTEIHWVTISDGVTSICEGAFKDCYEIYTIKIADSVSSIGANAFEGCAELTTINIPEGITRIEAETFIGCYALESVILPDSLTYIGDGAFISCEAMRSIWIPANVESIGQRCFYMSGLGAIKFAGDMPSIGNNAFRSNYKYFSAYYPAGNATYTSGNMLKYGHSQTRWQTYSGCSEHSFNSWKIVRDTTCEGDGLQVRYCSTCGVKETNTISASGHTFDNWKVFKIATTKEPGEERRTCRVCRYYESRAIAVVTVIGDFDGNDKVTETDAIYLLWHTLHPKNFPLDKNADFTGDSRVTDADVVVLLWHSLYPKVYPLK